jgi:PPM family protein phosphatase
VKCESRGTTDRGLRRHHNEDQLLIRDDLGLYLVADGMGGHAAGEVASELAVREVERYVEATANKAGDTWPNEWNPHLGLDANRLVSGIASAHRKVTAAVDGDLGLKGMGATIVGILFDPAQARMTIGHVGDSRAYLLHEGNMEVLTSDHSWVHEQVVAGLLTEDAARSHPLKNVVTRALGGLQIPAVDITERIVSPGDLLLLCSDGLNTMLPDDEIGIFLKKGADIGRLAHQLVAEANRRGGFDNITVVLVRVLD